MGTETQAVAWTTSATSTVTTGSFTPVAGDLVVAIVAVGNGSGVAGSDTAQISDSIASTWTLLKRQNVAGNGEASIWCCDAGASPAARTVTYTCSVAYLDLGITVRRFSGALSRTGQTGATAGGSGAPYSLAITPSAANSWVVGALGRTSSPVALTALANTSVYGQTQGAQGDTFAAFEYNALSTAGSPVTLGFTNTAATDNEIALAEIQQAATASPAGTIVLTSTRTNGTNVIGTVNYTAPNGAFASNAIAITGTGSTTVTVLIGGTPNVFTVASGGAVTSTQLSTAGATTNAQVGGYSIVAI